MSVRSLGTSTLKNNQRKYENFSGVTAALPCPVSFIVVGGGGSGGAGDDGGGGGGAGGYISRAEILSAGSYSLQVGAGGGARTPTNSGLSGGSSVFGTATATGGGGGFEAAFLLMGA